VCLFTLNQLRPAQTCTDMWNILSGTVGKVLSSENVNTFI
jgi:hypothetical protein